MKLTPCLIVSIHDVTPESWDRVKSILEQLSAVGVHRRSLLVIPNWKGQSPIHENTAFSAWLLQRQGLGDEIVLHGYEHVGVGEPMSLSDRLRNRFFTLNEGEFLSLDYAEARRRLELGIRIFNSAGIRSQGFVAPSWLINREGLAAVKDLGFEYTNSYSSFSDLSSGKSIFAPGLVFGPGPLNEDLGIRLQRIVSRIVARRPIVSIVIHPPCVDNPNRFAKIIAMTETQRAHHEPITYAALLAAWRGTRAGAQQNSIAGNVHR